MARVVLFDESMNVIRLFPSVLVATLASACTAEVSEREPAEGPDAGAVDDECGGCLEGWACCPGEFRAYCIDVRSSAENCGTCGNHCFQGSEQNYWCADSECHYSGVDPCKDGSVPCKDDGGSDSDTDTDTE